RDRTRGLADAVGGTPVGHDAEGVLAADLEQIGEQVELRRDVRVLRQGLGHPAIIGRPVRATICLPTYNEAENVERVVRALGPTGDWGAIRRAVSAGGSLYARALLGVPVRDLTGGFKCFRRHVLESIDLETVHARGYAFQIELTYRALRNGFSVVEVPIRFVD